MRCVLFAAEALKTVVVVVVVVVMVAVVVLAVVVVASNELDQTMAVS